MTPISEMTNAALAEMATRLDAIIRDAIREGRPTEDVVRLRNRIDDELWGRGA